MAKFLDIFVDVTKDGCKIPKENYLDHGAYPIIDQGQEYIAGFSDESEGLYEDVPAIIFGDHTRIIKYVDRPCFLGADGVKLLKARDSNSNYKYLYYALCHAKIPNTGYNRHFKWLKEIDIRLPSKNEQQHIVAILDKISDLISLRKHQLAKLDELVEARFVELFGDESKFDAMPLKENVEEMFIGPFGSSLKNDSFVLKEDGFCMVYEQKHAIQKTMNVKTRYVNEQKYIELKRFTVHGGDIIVSCRGTIGEIYAVPDDAPLGIMHPSIMKIRLSESAYNKNYFVFALKQYMQKHNAEANGSGVKMAVTATTIGQEMFIVPPMHLQKNFSNFVDQMGRQKLTIQKSLDKLMILEKSLMQKYFG